MFLLERKFRSKVRVGNNVQWGGWLWPGSWCGRREFALLWRGLLWPEEVASPLVSRLCRNYKSKRILFFCRCVIMYLPE